MNITNYDPNKRHRITFHLIIETLSPLSHIGESIGNQSNLKTTTITDIEGNPSDVFCVSGNSLRNRILRRCGFDSFLSAINIQVSPKMHHTLFCGGSIDGGTANDLELDKRIRQFVPPLSVLGTAKPKDTFGSKDAQMIPGKIAIGDALLVCYESALNVFKSFTPAIPYEALEGLTAIDKELRDLSEARVEKSLKRLDTIIDNTSYRETVKYWLPFLEEKLRPYSTWLAYNQKVRMDSHFDPALVKFMLPPVTESKQKTLFSESKSDEKSDKKDKSNQMIMGSWLLQQGAKLYSRWDGNLTDIEEGFVAEAILRWSENPYLGGQSNTGCGRVSINIYYSSGTESGQWISISEGSQILEKRASLQHERYQQYLESYREFLASNNNQVKGVFE